MLISGNKEKMATAMVKGDGSMEDNLPSLPNLENTQSPYTLMSGEISPLILRLELKDLIVKCQLRVQLLAM